MVFARFLQEEEEAAFASQIANDRNCARLLEEEEHVNDGVLPSDAERVLYKRMDDRTRATIACGDDEEAEWQLKQQRLRGIQAQRKEVKAANRRARTDAHEPPPLPPSPPPSPPAAASPPLSPEPLQPPSPRLLPAAHHHHQQQQLMLLQAGASGSAQRDRSCALDRPIQVPIAAH